MQFPISTVYCGRTYAAIAIPCTSLALLEARKIIYHAQNAEIEAPQKRKVEAATKPANSPINRVGELAH